MGCCLRGRAPPVSPVGSTGHCLRDLAPSPVSPVCAQAPRQREANGRLLGYRVALGPRRRGREPPTVCNTSDTHCDFTAPAGTRRVYLSAYNAAGESAATEVVLLERKGEGLKEHLSWAESFPPRRGLGGVFNVAASPREGEHPRGSQRGSPRGSLAACRGTGGSQLQGAGLGCSPLPSAPWLSPRRSAPGWAPGRTRR